MSFRCSSLNNLMFILSLLITLIPTSSTSWYSGISYDFFSQLSGCTKSTVSCEAWSSNFALDNADLVTIPCGKCISLGEFVAGETINLNAGLDILGTLYIPDGSKLTLSSTFITVQGQLSIYSSEVIDNDADIKIILKGTSDVFFTPNSLNTNACTNPSTSSTTTYCNIGKKTLAVAGGVLDIKAISDTCPTWVTLLDNIETNAVPIPATKMENTKPYEACDRFPLNEGFDYAGPKWRGSPGTVFEITNVNSHEDSNNYLLIKNRKKKWQGAFIDLKWYNISKCIVPDTTYLISMKLRFDSSNAASNTTCSKNGTDCMRIMLHTFDLENNPYWTTLWWMPFGAAVEDGTWFDLVAPITFSSNVFNMSHAFHSLVLAGIDPFVELSIDSVVLELPNINYPEQSVQCLDMQVNGNAEHSPLHSFPVALFGNMEAYLSIGIEESNGNKYHKIKGRTEFWTSVEVPLHVECLILHTYYMFTAKIWMQSDTDEIVEFAIKTTTNGEYFVRSIYPCAASSKSSGWVECQLPYMFREVHENADAVSFIIRSKNLNNEMWVDDIAVILDKTPVKSIVVPSTINECWGDGAEIMVTSHSLHDYDTITGVIESIAVGTDGTANITLTNTMEWHTTYKESPNTAVQVALLSRNVQMTHAGDDSSNPLHGGNLVILQSRNIPQLLQGVDFKEFGQQGLLGKYPIYYRLSQDNPNAVISKNTIRDSFQRCIVLQNTNNVTLSNNVAYNTQGHCYMTEDGLEESNTFDSNIGAATKFPTTLISILESDYHPCTYWITNPNNFFLNNVAAGSEHAGFCYEFLDTVRGESRDYDSQKMNPSRNVFGSNDGTISHSNQASGITFYPNGYFAPTQSTLTNFKSYVNVGSGLLFYNTENLAATNGFLSDNRHGVEIDKYNENIRVSNCEFYGYTERYKYIFISAQKLAHCPAYRSLTGIQLHSSMKYHDSPGYFIENNYFEKFGYDLTSCEGSSAINIDPHSRDTPGHFEAATILKNNVYEDGVPAKDKYDACPIDEKGVQDLAVHDITGDLNPVNPNVPGYVVSDSIQMTGFIDESNRHTIPNACAVFIENECFRRINFAVPLDEPYSNMVLRVTNSAGIEVDFRSHFEYVIKVNETSSFDNYLYARRRYFSPILPFGTYTFQFYFNGTTASHPTSFETYWDEEPTECSPFITNDEITIITTPAQNVDCGELIKNNNLEMGDISYWEHTGSNIEIYNPGFGDTGYALSTVWKTGSWQGPGQYIDTRCLVNGTQYEISAKFKLLDASGNGIKCYADITDYNRFGACPRVSMRVRRTLGDTKRSGVETKYVFPLAITNEPTSATDWNYLYGVLPVNEWIESATSVFVWVERFHPALKLVLDDFTISNTEIQCDDSSWNRGFEEGDARFWALNGEAQLSIVSPGYGGSAYAYKATNRNQWWASMSHYVKAFCFKIGKAYSISAKIKLERNGVSYDCDASKLWSQIAYQSVVCPTLGFQIQRGVETIEKKVGETVGPWKSGEWNDIVGAFIADYYLFTADTIFAYFTYLKQETDIIVDDLSIKEETDYGCDANMIYNGDAEYGDTRMFYPMNSGYLDTTTGNGGGTAIRYNGHLYNWEGVGQYVDRLCLNNETNYEISADVTLWDPVANTAYACDSSFFGVNREPWRCPVIAIGFQNTGERAYFQMVAYAHSTWDANGWNALTGDPFKISSAVLEYENVWFFVHHTKPGIDIIVDNFVLKKSAR